MQRRTPPRISAPPTDEELQLSLEMAREILADPDEDWFPANTFKLDEEFERLGLDTHEAQTDALRRAAAEVCLADYEQPEPPGLSNESACRGTPMLPFYWQSESFGSLMFFKFGLQRHGYLYVFSLHVPDFPRKRQRKR